LRRFVNREILDKPIFDVRVANSLGRGMLGIAVARNGVNTVSLYFTEAGDYNDGTDKFNKIKTKVLVARTKMNL
jgi:hypothetical protein